MIRIKLNIQCDSHAKICKKTMMQSGIQNEEGQKVLSVQLIMFYQFV